MEQRNSALATYLAHCQCLIVFYIEGVYWSFVRRPVCWCNALSICGLLWCDNNKVTRVERFFSCGTHTGWRRDWHRRFWSIERVHVFLVKKGNLYWPSLKGDLILLPGVILFLDARQQLFVKWQQGYCFENEVGKIVLWPVGMLDYVMISAIMTDHVLCWILNVQKSVRQNGMLQEFVCISWYWHSDN